MLFPHFTWSIHFVLFLSYFSTVEHFSLALKRFYSPLVRSYRVLGRNYVKFSRFSALALSSRVADVLPSPTAFLISVNFFVRIWPLGVFFPRPIARALSAVHFLSDWYCRRFGRSGTEGGGGGRGAAGVVGSDPGPGPTKSHWLGPEQFDSPSTSSTSSTFPLVDTQTHTLWRGPIRAESDPSGRPFLLCRLLHPREKGGGQQETTATRNKKKDIYPPTSSWRRRGGIDHIRSHAIAQYCLTLALIELKWGWSVIKRTASFRYANGVTPQGPSSQSIAEIERHIDEYLIRWKKGEPAETRTAKKNKRRKRGRRIRPSTPRRPPSSGDRCQTVRLPSPFSWSSFLCSPRGASHFLPIRRLDWSDSDGCGQRRDGKRTPYPSPPKPPSPPTKLHLFLYFLCFSFPYDSLLHIKESGDVKGKERKST